MKMVSKLKFLALQKHSALLLLLSLAEIVFSQPKVPIEILQARFMSKKSPTGVSNYDAYARLDGKNSYVQERIYFPSSGSYRFDLSAYSSYVPGSFWAQAQIRIDGVPIGTRQVNDTVTKMYSLLTKIAAGTHNIDIVVTGSKGTETTSKLYAGLLYVTKTTAPVPYVFPSIKALPLVPGKILTANHFGSGRLRGFNVSSDKLNSKDMMSMKQTGANIARYFIAISKMPGTNKYYFNTGELEKSDSAVAKAKRFQYYVVPTFQVFPEGLNEDFWGSADSAVLRRESLIVLWKVLAKRYKGNSAVAAYDLINEPRNNRNYAEWIDFASQLVESIRQVDSSHVIVIEHSFSSEMFAMMQPLPYTNLVYSPHSYTPLKITHQGVRDEYGTERISYPNTQKVYTKVELSKKLDPARALAKTYNVPIFIGEFSCINWAPLNSNGKWTSTQWVTEEISLFEVEKWAWCYHAWREWEGWDSEIPSTFYLPYAYINAKPTGFTKKQQRAARTPNAPTITELRKWFASNSQAYQANDIASK